MNMQNCLVHHLISTKLCCALPKWTLVQNYIVNLDLYVHCPPLNDYILCPCPCASPVHVHCQRMLQKCPPTSHGHRSPLRTLVRNTGRRCTAQVSGARCSPVLLRWRTTQLSQSQTDKHMHMDRTENITHNANVGCNYVTPQNVMLHKNDEIILCNSSSVPQECVSIPLLLSILEGFSYDTHMGSFTRDIHQKVVKFENSFKNSGASLFLDKNNIQYNL